MADDSQTMTITSPDAVEAFDFRQAMRKPASAVAIIATGRAGDRAGLTVTAVCSLSDSPPTVLACVHRRSSALSEILANGTFSVNFLGEDQAALANIFAGRHGRMGEERFDPDIWFQLETGAPVLRDALVSFDCVLEKDIDSPTHAILLGRVVGIATPAREGSLIYSQSSFGKFVPIAG